MPRTGELEDKPDYEGERTQDECREPTRNLHEPSLPLSPLRVRWPIAHRTSPLMTSDIARSEVRPTDPARLERAATLAMLRAGRFLTG